VFSVIYPKADHLVLIFTYYRGVFKPEMYRMLYNHALTDSNNKSSAVAEMGDRLDTIDMGRKLGGR